VQIIYAILCIVGTALPLAQFIPWLADRGLDFPLFIQQAVVTVGVSLALPLFLLLRERHLVTMAPDTSLERTRER
jgi:hypothetical protein